MRDIFVHPAGQDDNLGDSALRAGLIAALRGDGHRLHVYLEAQSGDYLSGIPTSSTDVAYSTRRAWVSAARTTRRPVYVVNAGEVSPKPGQRYPHARRAAEMRATLGRDGIVIAAGLGLKDPALGPQLQFDDVLRHASIMSWRDGGSRDAARFGEIAPDWAFALGSDLKQWALADEREFIAVTLRFDRPWPSSVWFGEVRALAAESGRRIVTLAQVARDAPRAVALAEELGGTYLVAPSTMHNDLDRHVRSIYARALAVVSDRAHALIMGATEGAYPIGTAVDPQKIQRLLAAVGLDALTGSHDNLGGRATQLTRVAPTLTSAIGAARRDLARLADNIQSTLIDSV